jgi:uncharacterized SAM-dependent methyltransferase
MRVPKNPGLDVLPTKWRAAALTPARPEIAREALCGLLASPKTLPSKLLYDEEGRSRACPALPLERTRDVGQDSTRFLVGIDLQKPVEVTAAFNRNLLVRLNREAGADFDVTSFRHRAVWNSVHSRVEMHLVSTKAQAVSVSGQNVEFAVDESIHTENSYKYTIDAFAVLAAEAGWRVERSWSDPRSDFSLQLLD